MFNIDKVKFAFFGSSRLSVIVLDELAALHLKPSLIVTAPDKPQGRKLVMTENVVKQWAVRSGIKVYDPAKLDEKFIEKLKAENTVTGFDVFVVASYGKIIPEAIIEMPARKTLNIHPSLLPRYRGASPLPTAMLDDSKETGVTIIKLDKEMDHGPIVAQKSVTVSEWPAYEDFEEMMAREGARLLALSLPEYVAGNITLHEQNHSMATYTKKIVKEDALLDLKADPYMNFRKIQAYHEWPQAFFVINRNGKDLRVKITAASFSDGKLTIEKVIPEAGREMSFKDFESGYGTAKGL